MNYKLEIANIVHSVLSEAHYSQTMSAEELVRFVERPKDESMGDYAFPCFLLSKALKKSPVQISQGLAEALEAKLSAYPQVEQISPAGPYVNFKLNTAELAKALVPEILSGDFLAKRKANGERMMVEYSQPNTHKAFHVGHMRNVALGSSISNICEWNGFDVVPTNYIGDVGTHIAKCLWYYTTHYKGEVPSTNRGEFLGELYVKGTEMLDFTTLTRAPHIGIVSAKVTSIGEHPNNEKWSVVEVDTGSNKHTVVCGGTGFKTGQTVAYAPVGQKVSGREVKSIDKKGVTSDGVICSEKEISISSDKNKIYTFEKDVPLGEPIAELLKVDGVQMENATVVEEMLARTEQVSNTLKRLEKNDPEMVKLWEETKKWSMDDFHEIYDWLNVKFDHYFFESDVAEPGKQIVDEYTKKGVFEKDEGAIGVKLDKFKLPFFMVLKSDGTGLYSTKDLALAKLKFEKYKIDRNVYVVDDGQSLHFQQVFKTLELMGFENAEKCFHLGYGKVERPDGKMSSRKGNVILFSTLKNTLTEKITSEFLEKYRGEWSDEKIDEAARWIALATIKYGMLNQDSVKNIVFDLDEWTARSGNTGPYLMYAYARTQSLLSEQSVEANQVNWSATTDPAEHSLINKLSQFPEVASKSSDKYEPQLVCIYLYELAKLFSSFYTQCPVLKAESDQLKLSRLALTQATGMTLKQGLNLLGIETLDQM